MDNIVDSAKEKLAEITGNITNLFKQDVLDAVKEYSVDKVNETWQQIEQGSEIFAKSGYTITSIDVSIGIPPTISLNVHQVENISDEEEEALLESCKDKTVLCGILVALFKANALQKSIVSTKFKFSGLTIGLGITPSMDMKFSKVD